MRKCFESNRLTEVLWNLEQMTAELLGNIGAGINKSLSENCTCLTNLQEKCKTSNEET